ncbi:Bug family tripartite tricarboxylate transporter substrate binding protein [Variovorax sp. PBL-E5]|uniref:Bug family tripartite tricarboxylate transporter substrate binding protein n=1 Tax=Variovorax sp. PBL-E5 TaxID=434014 RepID=UPI001319962F|nr:tripartite tricarboxylate transporter substrate binding protein [Variovorax sp. PBL-E5]VTU37503.1 Argininosuccinate lyase [Variovorax sp. PBL-E5]
MNINRRMAMAGIAAAVAAPAVRAASGWPERQIKWIVPFAAGGSTDAFSRLAAEQLSNALGQPLVVENITGASGAIGLERLARAAPDGYTLGTIPNSLQTMLPYVTEIPLPYDPMKSFVPIGGFAQFQYVFVVSSSSPIKTLDELISIGRTQPGKLSFGTTGPGTGNHLATVLLARKTGAEFTYVPYKGASQSVVDLLGGHIDLIVDIVGGVDALIREGKLRPLATTGARRLPLLPDVPTVSETIPGYHHVGWFGLYGPAGLPPAIVTRLNAELQRAQVAPKYGSALVKLGYEPMPGSSADLDAQQKREYAQWGAILKKT